jgi:AcrR family transcriptional regulator
MTTTGTSGSGDLKRSLELLWGTQERPSRGPKPSLRLDQIVTAAIKVADAEGLAALSMRRVAAELGVGTMSLYRYVPGKGELLDLMLEAVSAPSEPAASAADQGWRAVLETFARELRQLYLTHPWLLQVNWSRPLLGPNSLAGVEVLLHGLRGTALSDQEKIAAITVIDAFVAGAARSHVNALTVADETGVSDEEFWATQVPVLERAMASGRYPILAELAEDSFSGGWEQTFEFGLRRLLDGIEVLLASRQ